MFLELDGPAVQTKLSVGTATVVEVKVGASSYGERKVVTMQPIGGNVYLYFGDGITTPSAATVSANGFVLYQNGAYTYEASATQPLYVVSVIGTIDLIIAERA